MLRSTAGTALAVRLKRADEFVRAVGAEYPPDALRDELARFRLPDDKVEGLVATARRAA